jgi:hypothetical protein
MSEPTFLRFVPSLDCVGDETILEALIRTRGEYAAEIERLREALRSVMIGGNHVALLIGADHPSHTVTHDEALAHYGAGDQYEAWCCWRSIMHARAALSPPPAEDAPVNAKKTPDA